MSAQSQGSYCSGSFLMLCFILLPTHTVSDTDRHQSVHHISSFCRKGWRITVLFPDDRNPQISSRAGLTGGFHCSDYTSGRFVFFQVQLPLQNYHFMFLWINAGSLRSSNVSSLDYASLRASKPTARLRGSVPSYQGFIHIVISPASVLYFIAIRLLP